MHKVTVLGQPSYRVTNDKIDGWVAEAGGQLGPVEFRLSDKLVYPLHVAPWAEDELDPNQPQIIKTLRGDFFCMPFGGAPSEFQGEQHPVHGETANETWKFEEASDGYLKLSLTTKIRPGRVTKEITLKPGQSAIYQRHTIEGNHGPMTFGHHAMLHCPSEPGSTLISVSPFDFGQVFPGRFENPEEGGYTWLKPGAFFTSLDAVPAVDGSTMDLSRFPYAKGWENLVTVYSTPGLKLGWSAAVFPDQGYCWFSLRDPSVLTGTVIWISHAGRHYAPWNGRHTDVYALEDVTTTLPPGIAPSSEPNPASESGHRTYFELKDEPLVVNTVMAVTEIPTGFDHVATIEPIPGGVRLTSRSGLQVEFPTDLP